MATHYADEALERTIAEIEVLESIYGCEGANGKEGETAFRVASTDELTSARAILSSEGSPETDTNRFEIPRLDVVLQLPLDIPDTTTGDSKDDRYICVLRCAMPPGYPILKAVIVSVDIPLLTRSVQDDITRKLRQYANNWWAKKLF